MKLAYHGRVAGIAVRHSNWMRPALTALAIALFVGGLRAQTIELRSGEVAIGRVVAVNASSVDVAVGFPDATTRSIQKSDLTPVSLYTILAAQAEPGNAAARVELAEAARGLGLRGHAIAEYHEAARLDSEFKAKAQVKVMEIRTEIARVLVEDARQAIDGNWFGAASLGLSAIDASYGGTPVGQEAARDREVGLEDRAVPSACPRDCRKGRWLR